MFSLSLFFWVSHLEFVLLTSDACPLLLPEVVRLDDVGCVHLVGEELLQHLQDGLDRRPGRAAHVDHHGEAQVTHVVTATERRGTKKLKKNYMGNVNEDEAKRIS